MDSGGKARNCFVGADMDHLAHLDFLNGCRALVSDNFHVIVRRSSQWPMVRVNRTSGLVCSQEGQGAAGYGRFRDILICAVDRTRRVGGEILRPPPL